MGRINGIPTVNGGKIMDIPFKGSTTQVELMSNIISGHKDFIVSYYATVDGRDCQLAFCKPNGVYHIVLYFYKDGSLKHYTSRSYSVNTLPKKYKFMLDAALTGYRLYFEV
jgi:hypothetical protein